MTNYGDKTVVIMAAVSEYKSASNPGIKRQLLKIRDEPILYRAIRLLKERGVKNIYLTVPEMGYYGDTGVTEIVGKDKSGMGRFLNFKEHLKDEAIFLYGDVYYTENAIDTILKDENEWRLFGRAGKSNCGVKSWGEPFAFKVNKYVMEKAEELKKIANQLPRCICWELYRYLNGYPLNQHIVKDNFTEINDQTDDFDRYEDYLRFKSAMEK